MVLLCAEIQSLIIESKYINLSTTRSLSLAVETQTVERNGTSPINHPSVSTIICTVVRRALWGEEDPLFDERPPGSICSFWLAGLMRCVQVTETYGACLVHPFPVFGSHDTALYGRWIETTMLQQAVGPAVVLPRTEDQDMRGWEGRAAGRTLAHSRYPVRTCDLVSFPHSI